MTDEIRLSVALVTRNRPESLLRALRSLRAQEVQPYEVVVSDDSEPDYVEASRAIATGLDCRYITGPRRGLYANRNFAAQACRGSHVRTMDDDNEFPHGHNARVIEAVKSDPEAIWTIGQYRPEVEARCEGLRCPPQLHPRGYSVRPASTDAEIWAVNDAATVYPMTVFRTGERFAEDFLFGSAFLEFGSLLRWRGYRIRHLDGTYVISHIDFGRSFPDARIQRASSVFAALCHAFIYQRTISNRLQAAGQAMLECAKGGPTACEDVLAAWKAYRRRRTAVEM